MAQPVRPEPRARRLGRGSVEHGRLAAALTMHGHLFDHLVESSRRRGEDESWVPQARALLDEAASALRRGALDEGWQCFQAAERLEVLGMSAREVEGLCLALHRESAEKLRDWRRQTILALLEQADPAADLPAARERLMQARALRDEHFANQHHKVALLRRHRRLHAVVLVLAVAALAWLIGRGWIELDERTSDLAEGWTVPAVVLAGAAGASFSTLLSIGRTLGGRIPDQVFGLLNAGMRPLVGGGAALIVYVFLHAGVLSEQDPTVAGAVGLAFAAGFTERLVLGAVATVSGETRRDDVSG